jgi:hypothetical protein
VSSFEHIIALIEYHDSFYIMVIASLLSGWNAGMFYLLLVRTKGTALHLIIALDFSFQYANIPQVTFSQDWTLSVDYDLKIIILGRI